MSKTVIAVFDSIEQARAAAQALRASGFDAGCLRVQTGEQLLARGAAADAPLARFLAETAAGAASARMLGARDSVIVLEGADERAEEAAAILDAHGAIDLEARRRASGTEGTPPLRERVERYDDIDERALVASPAPGRGTEHRARIYAGR